MGWLKHRDNVRGRDAGIDGKASSSPRGGGSTPSPISETHPVRRLHRMGGNLGRHDGQVDASSVVARMRSMPA